MQPMMSFYQNKNERKKYVEMSKDAWKWLETNRKKFVDGSFDITEMIFPQELQHMRWFISPQEALNEIRTGDLASFELQWDVKEYSAE